MAQGGGGNRILAILAANLKASPAKSAVLGIGFVVLVVLLVRLAAGSGPKSAAADEGAGLLPASTTAAAVAATPTGGDGEADAVAVREPRLPRPRVRQTLGRDPFSPSWLGTFAPAGDAAVAKEGDLVLQMVLTANGGPSSAVAVISGVMVYPGSWISGYEVTDIARGRVTLRNRNETIQLRMP